MAFADLLGTQMVDENNASTGGFTAIGPKLSPPNKCYTKAEALAAYNLNATLMNGYANNQLVPKDLWVSGVVPLTYVPLGYEGVNCLYSSQGGYTFLQARLTANGTVSPVIEAGCNRVAPPSFVEFQIQRGFMGFNGALVPTITNGGIKINIPSLVDNTLTAPTKFVIVRTGIVFPYNHVWVVADFDECINFVDESGNTPYTNVVTINPGQTGDIFFPFNTAGINYVNANTDLNFVIMENDHDWAKIAPTAFSDNEKISSPSSTIKLYYESPSGVGTCKCVFNGSNYVFEFTLNTGISGTAVTTNGFCTANQGTNSTSGLNTFSVSGTPLTATFRSLSSFNNGSSATMIEVSITLDFNGGAQIKTFKSTADIVFTASEITAGTIKNIIYDQIT